MVSTLYPSLDGTRHAPSISPAKGPSSLSARLLSVTDVVDRLLRLRIAAWVEEKSIFSKRVALTLYDPDPDLVCCVLLGRGRGRAAEGARVVGRR